MNGEGSLGVDNSIAIRLRSIELPDDRNAIVTFELYSTGHNVGDPTRQMMLIQQAAPRLPRNGSADYDSIVAWAAEKLNTSFKSIVKNLSSTYSSG